MRERKDGRIESDRGLIQRNKKKWGCMVRIASFFLLNNFYDSSTLLLVRYPSIWRVLAPKWIALSYSSFRLHQHYQAIERQGDELWATLWTFGPFFYYYFFFFLRTEFARRVMAHNSSSSPGSLTLACYCLLPYWKTNKIVGFACTHALFHRSGLLVLPSFPHSHPFGLTSVDHGTRVVVVHFFIALASTKSGICINTS